MSHVVRPTREAVNVAKFVIDTNFHGASSRWAAGKFSAPGPPGHTHTSDSAQAGNVFFYFSGGRKKNLSR